MKLRQVIISIFAVAMGAALVSAQGVWEKKDWKQWSKDDCKKILEDSPWAQKWENSVTMKDQFGQPTGGTGRESEQKVYYIIQLRSALPVRQAFIRRMQMENNYEKMSADQKKQFDESAERYLSRKYDDVVVVHVLYGSNIAAYAKEMKRIWQGYPEDAPPSEINLVTSAGVRVRPLKILSAPGGAMEFELFFPRKVNGQPIVTAAVKSVGVEFNHPDLSKAGVETSLSMGRAIDESTTDKVTRSGRVYKDFKIEKMIVNGEVVY